MLKVVVIASTNGSVLGRLLEVPYFRERIWMVVSDRPCGAIDKARKYGIVTIVEESQNSSDFSDFLLKRFENTPPDLFVSFYTRLFKGQFLVFAKDNLVNLHPSILPACPGVDGFGDTVKAGAKFIGATVHFVDEGVDTGYPVIQSAIPFNPGLDMAQNRHKIFVQQCQMLLQLFNWWETDRVGFDAAGRPVVSNAAYEAGVFSPNLDFKPAIEFDAKLET